MSFAPATTSSLRIAGATSFIPALPAPKNSWRERRVELIEYKCAGCGKPCEYGKDVFMYLKKDGQLKLLASICSACFIASVEEKLKQ